MIYDVMNHLTVLCEQTTRVIDPYHYYYVIRSCVICHGGSHACACLNGNLHTKYIVLGDRIA